MEGENPMQNNVREGLAHLWKEQKQEALSDHMKFRGLLRDYCPRVGERELNLLVYSVQYGIAMEILQFKGRTLDTGTMHRLVDRTEKATGFQEEHIHYVIGLWANVLGAKLSREFADKQNAGFSEPSQINESTSESSLYSPPPYTPNPTAYHSPDSKGKGIWSWVIAACIGLVLVTGGGWYGYTRYHSSGQLTLADGSSYVGDIRWGKASGTGQLKYSDGRIYQGECLDGVPNGKGLLTLSDGSKYEGEFKDGKRQGTGKLYNTSSLLVYDGSWANDTPSGIGTAFMVTGEKYIGGFRAGQRFGSGQLFSNSGELVYDGEWYNDKRHGRGKWLLADGSKYEGSLAMEQKDGEGRLYGANSQLVYDGYWKNNQKHGLGTWILPNGAKFKGNFVFDKMTGQFVVNFPSGEKYEGPIMDDRINGVGTYTWVNGDKYTGNWKDNVMHGPGTMTLANGTIVNGTWDRGIYQEQQQAAQSAVSTNNVSQEKPRETSERNSYQAQRQANVKPSAPTAARTPEKPRETNDNKESVAKKRSPNALEILAALVILVDKHKK